MKTLHLPRVIIQYEQHANDVLDGLQQLIKDYGEARVSDYKELLKADSMGPVPEYYEYWYGWQELDDVKITWADGGYVILLPEPILVDDGGPEL